MSQVDPEKEILDELDSTRADIEKTTEELDKYDDKIRPVLFTTSAGSATLSTLGTYQILPQTTPYLETIAVLTGLLITVVYIGFWTWLFKRAKDVRTNGGVAIIALLFIVAGFFATAPSTGTNFAAVTSESGRVIDEQETVVVYSKAIASTDKIKSQLTELKNFLSSQKNSFETRYQNEVSGRGTGRSGRGHVANALLEVSGRFSKHLPIVNASLNEYGRQRARLDESFTAFQAAREDGNQSAEFERLRNEMNALLTSIAAINPKTIANGAASHIKGKIPVPFGARSFQVTAIQTIQTEVSRLAGAINEIAARFQTIEVPSKKVRSKVSVAWVNVLQNWPMAVLAVGIDLLAPTLFLMKLPGLLGNAFTLKKLTETQASLKRNLAAIQGPSMNTMAEYIFNDIVNSFRTWTRSRHEMFTIGMKGHRAFEQGAAGYKKIMGASKITPPKMLQNTPQSSIKTNFDYSKDYCETFMFENQKGGAE